MGDRRVWHDTICAYCGDWAEWLVFEDSLNPESEWMMVCEKHRYTAFS